MAAEESNMLLAFVALNSPRTPTQEQVAALAQDKYGLELVPHAEGNGDNGVFFDSPHGMAFFSLMPAPIPWGDLEGPCRTTLFWQDAEQTLRNHTHHFISSLLEGPGTPLERHIWFTKFVAAVAELSDVAGIYWGGGTVVNSPEVFCGQAEVLADDDLFPPLWIDHRIWKEGRKVRFATTGLHAFGLPELEAEGEGWPPGELFEFCQNLVTYVIQRGAPIPDGDSVGRTAEEKLKIRHARSMWERDGLVMNLTIP